VITDTVEAIDNIQLQGKFADSDRSMLSWIINFEDSNYVYKQHGHTVSYDYAKGNYVAYTRGTFINEMGRSVATINSWGLLKIIQGRYKQIRGEVHSVKKSLKK